MEKTCSKCGESKDAKGFGPVGRVCRGCKNTRQRQHRLANSNFDTKKYEKTKSGFLMRLYRNMRSRIDGTQKVKAHLYEGRDLLPKDEFYSWAWASEPFHSLYEVWAASGYSMKLAPSVDRINSALGYSLSNMEWVTHSENSRRGAVSVARNHLVY